MRPQPALVLPHGGNGGLVEELVALAARALGASNLRAAVNHLNATQTLFPTRAPDPGPDPESLSSVNLLIVDDQAVVAAGLARLLEDAGHSVQWCTDLAGARQALSGPLVVDLLLLDVHLGPQDGLGFAREVRTRSHDDFSRPQP